MIRRNPVNYAFNVKGVIHWVSADHAQPAEFRLYDRLFSVPNPAAAEDFLAVINPESLTIKNGFVEPSLRDVEPTTPVSRRPTVRLNTSCVGFE